MNFADNKKEKHMFLFFIIFVLFKHRIRLNDIIEKKGRIVLMKKIFLFAAMMLFFIPAGIAADVIPSTIYAVTPENISNKTLEKNQEIELYAIDDYDLDEIMIINKGSSVKVKIKEYVKPKRGKLDGYYRVEYINEKLDPDIVIEGKMRVSTPKDMKSIAKSAGVSLAGHILKIPGFSQAVAVSKGLIKPNEDETRLQSAGKNLYESTPLTYAEKGKDFAVEEDGIVVLKLRVKEPDNQ